VGQAIRLPVRKEDFLVSRKKKTGSSVRSTTRGRLDIGVPGPSSRRFSGLDHGAFGWTTDWHLAAMSLPASARCSEGTSQKKRQRLF
jgi:hypothetical protein